LSGPPSAGGGANRGAPPAGSLDDCTPAFIDASCRLSRDLAALHELLDSGAIDPATAHAIRLTIRLIGHVTAMQASSNQLFGDHLELLTLLTRRSSTNGC
jgi:hypothetical protein